MKENHSAFLRWISDQRVAQQEPFLLLALLCVLLAILLALLGIRKARHTSREISPGRMSNELQDVSVRLHDLNGRFGAEKERQADEIKQLKERYSRLEHELARLAKRPHEDFKENLGSLSSEEKKNQEITSDLSPGSSDQQFSRDERSNETTKFPPILSREKLTHPVAPPEPRTVPRFEPRPADIAPKTGTPPSLGITPQQSAKPFIDGLEKTRSSLFSRLRGLFETRTEVGPELFTAMEELLLGSDLGVQTSKALLAKMQNELRHFGSVDEEAIRGFLKQSIFTILDSPQQSEIVPKSVGGMPFVILVVGVNGVGKTTTIGKLASVFKAQGKRVLLGACDTFRAAATDQLGVWAERVGVEIVTGADGAKPSTVAFQAIHRGKEGAFDVVILDTAGRLHTRVNLMNELGTIVSIVEREQPGAPHETILVLDATTGQNALQQARDFHSVSKLTGIVVTKLDGTPKGGIVVAIKDELGIPIRYLGVGEGVEDLRPFSALQFVEALFTPADDSKEAGALSERGKVRRRRRDGAENPV